MIYSLSSILTFGVHEGKTIQELLDQPQGYDYIVELIRDMKNFSLDKEAMAYARQKLRQHVATVLKSGEGSDYDTWKIKQELRQFDDKLTVSHSKGE